LNGHQCFLNPDGESEVLTETSDKEIYHAVMDLIKARKNIDINGGDDVDDDSPMEPHPTRREVLRALSTIGKCIEASNDPIARKLDALMETFSQQLCLNETQSMRLLSRHISTLASTEARLLTSTVLGRLCSSALRRAMQW
jgi:hypothetical protein